MALSTIVIGVLFIYLIYYGVIIAHDLLSSSDSTTQPLEDEIEIQEVDNTLPLSSFSSTSVISSEEVMSSSVTSDETVLEGNQATMNGGISIDDLCAQIQQSNTPSELSFVANAWNS